MSEGENIIDMERFRSLGRSAFVLGYTGEVGKVLVDELNKSKIFKRVVLIGRREVPLSIGPEFVSPTCPNFTMSYAIVYYIGLCVTDKVRNPTFCRMSGMGRQSMK